MKDNDQLILDMFTSGISMRRIAEHFEIHINKVVGVLRKNGASLDDAEIARLYAEKKTPAEIAEVFGCDQSTILRRLRMSGVEIRTISEAKQKWFVNDGFFKKIDNSIKAYWLGMMFADGYVKSNLRDFGLTLKISDIGHVQKFANDIGYTGEIFKGEKIVKGREFGYARIVLANRKVCTDLIAHGCVPQKTFSLAEPIGVPEQFYRDFIRGVVDGDGGIHIYEKMTSLEIVGTYDLLQWISDSGPSPLSGPQKHKNIWRARIGVRNSFQWIEWLYKDAEVYLERKAQRANAVIERGF